jgi:hypothetical protein
LVGSLSHLPPVHLQEVSWICFTRRLATAVKNLSFHGCFYLKPQF